MTQQNVFTLTLRNVRTFTKRYDIPFRRLNFVIGENSAGKTSLLASLYSVLGKDFPLRTNFNTEPFDFGAFESIASNTGGARPKSKEIELGYSKSHGEEDENYTASYYNEGGQPTLRSFSLRRGDREIRYRKAEDGEGLVTLRSGDQTYEFESKSPTRSLAKLGPSNAMQFIQEAVFQGSSLFHQNSSKKPTKQEQAIFEKAISLVFETMYSRPEVLAIAPIRTKPQRIYEIFESKYDVEGNHIPHVITQTLAEKSSSSGDFINFIQEFGDRSGMFLDIESVKLGTSKGAPFSIKVAGAKGPGFSLSDVGYGVSQSIPIVAQIYLSSANGWVLVQQPEVHLHPKAQAALGDSIVEALKGNKKNIVIETHSDYLVDRVRLLISKGMIAPADVGIIFLEKKGTATSVHHLNFDEMGNILDAPSSYREFFLEEQSALLNR